jgi:hypothetical protein
LPLRPFGSPTHTVSIITMTTHTPTPKSLKRNYQRMMMDQHCQGMVPVDYYNEFPPGVFYTPPPPPPQHVLFSNPFPSPYEYCSTPDGYLPSSSGESTGYFAGHRSLSEPFAPGADSSFSSGSSSCNASVGPATPPPTQTPGGHPRYSSGQLPKFPAIPITPSHVVPRQKAKRTATVSHFQRSSFFRLLSLNSTTSNLCRESC